MFLFIGIPSNTLASPFLSHFLLLCTANDCCFEAVLDFMMQRVLRSPSSDEYTLLSLLTIALILSMLSSLKKRLCQMLLDGIQGEQTANAF